MKQRTLLTSDLVRRKTAAPTVESLTEALFCRLDPVLRGLSRKIAGEFTDLKDDLFQEGALGVINAVASFKPSKGSLDHYATKCARGRMLNYRRTVTRRLTDIPLEYLIDESKKEGRSAATYSARLCLSDRDCVRQNENRLDVVTIWSSAARILTANERIVIQSIFFDGIRAKEVAHQLGLSAPRITQLYATGIAKLQSRFRY